MRRRGASWIEITIAAALSWAAFAVPTWADRVSPSLYLGPPAASGPEAVAGIPARAGLVVRSEACGDELNFLLDIFDGEQTGDFPLGHLMAKAAYLTDAFIGPQNPATGVFAPMPRLCQGVLVGVSNYYVDAKPLFFADPAHELQPRYPGAEEDWKNLNDATDPGLKTGYLIDAINSTYARLFGDACTRASGRFLGAGIAVALTPACLMRQVQVVINDPWLGPWKVENGVRILAEPGTTPSKLPCAINWLPFDRGQNPDLPWSHQNAAGEWDMSVINYTRIAYLLYRARSVHPELMDDADSALSKMNLWLLSLRGEPARETYDVVTSCGNPDNNFGTATDYLEDNDVYNGDLGRAVSGEDEGESSFWKDLGYFLLSLLAVALAAALVGFIIGAILGVISGVSALAGMGAAIAATVVVGVVLLGSAMSGIEETENHLLMQNTSKYLKNKLMLAELRAGNDHSRFDEIVNQNETTRQWLLKRMRRIVRDDFVEYNAKPYNRLSLVSILNLMDYACQVSWDWNTSADPPPAGDQACDPRDQAIVNAAGAVLDLSATKMALSSLQGRRLIPYRRLVEFNVPHSILEVGSGGDHLVAAMQLWAGTAQHGHTDPNNNYLGWATPGSASEMLWHATSRYRPNELILDLAVDKSTAYEQALTHGGSEYYASGRGWLLTAGGDSTHAAQGFRMISVPGEVTYYWWPAPENDRGAGVPTTLMAAGRITPRDSFTDFLRFEGTPEQGDNDGKPIFSYSRNQCVVRSFACGIRFEIPAGIMSCLSPAPPGSQAPANLHFLSSATCEEYRDGDNNTANDFFVAVYRAPCDGGLSACQNKSWGFIEIAQADDFGGSLETYARAVVAANAGNFNAWESAGGAREVTFKSVTQNRDISFDPRSETFGHDCRACGDIITSGNDDRFVIHNPRRTGTIVLDFSDLQTPVRRGEGGTALDP